MAPEAPFHDGEIMVQRRAGVADMASKVGRGIHHSFPPVAAGWTALQKFIAVGGARLDGSVWATALLGEPGFLTVRSPDHLTVTGWPQESDPVYEVIQAGGSVGAIVLEPEARRRLRCNGLARLEPDGWGIDAREVYANCPQYIQPRHITPPAAQDGAEEAVGGDELLPSHKQWIADADTFFIATTHAERGADCSHRGGPKGFVTVQGAELSWADFPGNAMFNTLGNLQLNPACGLVFVDWNRSRMLQLSGTAELVWSGESRQVIFRVRQWREGSCVFGRCGI